MAESLRKYDPKFWKWHREQEEEFKAWIDTAPRNELTHFENWLIQKLYYEQNKLRDVVTEAIELFEIQYAPGIADPLIVPQLQELCEAHGYGNVIATASVLWHRKDPVGAFSVGHCFGTIKRFLKSAKDAIKK